MPGSVLLPVGPGMPIVYFASFFSSLRKQVLVHDLSRPQHVYTITLTKRADGIHADNGKEQADYARRDVHHIYRDLIATDLFLTPQRAFILPHTCVEERRRGTLEDDRKESSQ